VLAGVDAAAWPVFIEERSRERKLGTSVSGRILSAGPGVPSPPPSTYNSASARLQPAAPRHADPSFIKARGMHRRHLHQVTGVPITRGLMATLGEHRTLAAVPALRAVSWFAADV